MPVVVSIPTEPNGIVVIVGVVVVVVAMIVVRVEVEIVVVVVVVVIVVDSKIEAGQKPYRVPVFTLATNAYKGPNRVTL